MINLLELYIKLVGLILVGFILGWKLPSHASTYVGQFLFWVGVPISIIGFLIQTDLSGQIWIAPVIAHLAIFLGALLAWLKIKVQAYLSNSVPQRATQGSLILAAMVGNTGYLGFPITLAMVGKEYFAWALFYDMLGSLFGAYGLGVVLAAKFANNIQNHSQIAKVIFINPALWSFGVGLLLHQFVLPSTVVFCLEKLAWGAVALSLMLIGMRLSQLKSWRKLPQAGSSIFIKMLLVPLILGSTLSLFGVTGNAAQVIVLQMGMPPALATLVIAETFNLDRDLAVTALAMGIIVLLFTLPVWLWLF
ncbi:AEC family transporter [Dolichospermum sp. ST_sed1]|nr:AEC family transporter [Dolichospermum sp. ST_sed1]MDD1423992.1 AEC family transporter [Dolichospermum sp. ST_sed9]MDD1430516.1 AEC family transporter [Dolichospermum sp. ST_sed6]MDD1439917.1 AEC family transporter [Dolichospermum sp. ST_sed3]MDD1445706.1 AEC family transporter [Dolichospermum sp. ST_sed8]MDD1454089.1 AEC family transporter [Dolichospermum sp. ST_sed7]MDD1460308.1 AEC family transporter [Dolichospermum sp. ST_sed2]MDD1465016.1 AEC family transporter [Dolichospermum sp. ST